jgi:YHS domain-containing protein
MSVRVFGVSAVALLVGALVVAEEAKKEEFSVKCLVAGTAAKQDKTADYKGAKVYFCCDNCKGKFTADAKKFAIPANAQLASTKQAKQVKCPLSGQPIDAEKTVEVSGVKVAFCCENCQGKVADAKGDAQKELVFADAAFDKAFEVPKKK